MTDKQIINERKQYEYKSVYQEKSIIIDGADVSGCPHYIHKDGSCSSQDCECIKCVHNECFYKDYKSKEQECERLKWYLKEIRDDELKTLDIELDEYETHCIDTEYTNIINLVEEALEERNPEDCRYGK